MAYTDDNTVVDGLMTACDNDEQFIRLSEIFQFREAILFKENTEGHTLEHLYSQVAENNHDYNVLRQVFG